MGNVSAIVRLLDKALTFEIGERQRRSTPVLGGVEGGVV
jgi:hypothetical protein